MLPRHIILLVKICMSITYVNSQSSPDIQSNTKNITPNAIRIRRADTLLNNDPLFNNTKANANLMRSVKNKGSDLKELTKPRHRNKKKESYSNEHDLFDFDYSYYDNSHDSYYDSDSLDENKPSVNKHIKFAKAKYNSTKYEDTDFGNNGSPLYHNSNNNNNNYKQTDFRESSSEKEDVELTSGFEGLFHTLYDPVQNLITSIFKERVDQNAIEQNHHMDNDNHEQYSSEQPSLLNGWFKSLFGFNRRTKELSSSTKPVAVEEGDREGSSWFNSWFGLKEEQENFNNWFSNWFGSLPDATVALPQLPFVSIVDPHTNSQSLIGILSNSTIPFNIKTTNTSSKLKNKLRGALSYHKYQIWSLKPGTQAQVRVLEKYKQNDYNKRINWLRGPSLRGCTDVLISPTMLENIENFLISESISHEVKVFDVGKVINYEKNTDRNNVKNLLQLKIQSSQTMPWKKYYDYDNILKYLESVRSRNAKKVELIHIGRSYEGRPLIIVKISSKDALKTTASGINFKTLKMKKTWEDTNSIFIETGIHGMEWIGPATATWIINEILQIMRKKNITNMEHKYIRNTTWYIMPVLNPDGYAYSHDNDRFWRKTRSRHKTDNGFINTALSWLQQKPSTSKYCFGVDLDKNWSWGGKSSPNVHPCNALFAGSHPLSEPETKALSQFIMEHRKNIKLFVSLQAYGQVVKYPHKENASTSNAEAMEDILDVANQGVNGLRKSGSKTRYHVDFFNDFIEKRSGSSDAFALYKASVPFAYTIYLADNGVHGILLPSSLIEKTSSDAFKIIISMLSYVYEL